VYCIRPQPDCRREVNLKLDPVATPYSAAIHARVTSAPVEARKVAGAVFALLALLQTVSLELRSESGERFYRRRSSLLCIKHRNTENSMLEDRCISGSLIRLSLLNAAFIEES
jgi:hypothetical protein